MGLENDIPSSTLGTIFRTQICVYVWNNRKKSYLRYRRFSGKSEGWFTKDRCESRIAEDEWTLDNE